MRTITQTEIIHLRNHKRAGALLFIICLIAFNRVYSADKPFLATPSMPPAFQKQLKTVNGEFKVAYGMRKDNVQNEIINYRPEEIRQFIFKEPDYEKLFRCPFWIAMDSTRYCSFLPELINALMDTTYIGLTNAFDVTIWCRVKTGQLKDNTYNYQIDDDVFKVCGRANWILKRLSKNEFGNIRCDTKPENIQIIQGKWMKWLNTLKVK